MSVDITKKRKEPPLRNSIWDIKWSRDRWRRVTMKRQTRDPKRANTLRAQYLENSWRCYLATIANLLDSRYEAVLSAILATVWFLVLEWCSNFMCYMLYDHVFSWPECVDGWFASIIATLIVSRSDCLWVCHGVSLPVCPQFFFKMLLFRQFLE